MSRYKNIEDYKYGKIGTKTREEISLMSEEEQSKYMQQQGCLPTTPDEITLPPGHMWMDKNKGIIIDNNGNTFRVFFQPRKVN